MLKEHIKKMTEDWGLEAPIEPTVPGVWHIPVEDAYVIALSAPDSETIVFSADLGSIPSGKREECYQTLLNANLFGQGTAQLAVLGLNPDNSQVKLQAMIPQSCSYDFFSGTLEEFINLCDYWKDEVHMP